ITVHSLGTVIHDRPNFHNERYIFPVGFTSSRDFFSIVDPEKTVRYTSTVLDGGEGPRFQVVPEDAVDKAAVATSATGAWTSILKAANILRNREHSNSASGPDYFGFSQPTIQKLIQELPNANLCSSYKMQKVCRHRSLPFTVLLLTRLHVNTQFEVGLTKRASRAVPQLKRRHHLAGSTCRQTPDTHGMHRRLPQNLHCRHLTNQASRCTQTTPIPRAI
ncbi:F/Y rich C-terminus-domain-containing protein, partial [Entophlyctis helioformis]